MQVLQPPSPTLLTWCRTPVSDRAIASFAIAIRTRHHNFPCILSLLFNVLPENLVAPTPYKRNERDTDEKRETEEDDVDGYGIVMERLVCSGVECGL